MPAGPGQAGIERAPQLVERVNAAIDRGVTWLRRHEDPGGGLVDHAGFPGATTALGIYTLRVCGVKRDDPVLIRAYRALREQYDRRGRGDALQTYTAALYLMAIAEQGARRPPTALSAGDCLLEQDDAAWMGEIVEMLERSQKRHGGWHYDEGAGAGEDHSNTQYALLGLRAASEVGVPVKLRTYHRALRHLVGAQEKDGPPTPRFVPGAKGATSDGVVDEARGWSYMDGGGAYGSMTAGCVGSLVICRSQLLGSTSYAAALDDRAERSIRDGIAWLGRNFSVSTNPGPAGRTMAGPRWLYYYLYAVERAGMLAGVDWMGDRDWYGEGARYLLDEQLEDGSWSQALAGPVSQQRAVTTCFALLFLEKGTAPVRRGALTKPPDETEINWAAISALRGADFEDFVDLLISRWHRAPDAAARGRLMTRAGRVGARLVLPLLVRMDSSDERERRAAFAVLRHVTGETLDYDPTAAPGSRDAALGDWEAWWFRNEASLRYDLEVGRLVWDR